MSELDKRLHDFLKGRSLPIELVQLTPDASTREYFRIKWFDSTAIACVYPESFVAAEQSYLDVTALFEKVGLPVAKVFDFDEELGIIIQEDLGDTTLRDVLVASDPAKRDILTNRAIDIIPHIQAATQNAFELNSIASRLKFDVEKLMWELDFFATHYFATLRNRPLEDNKKAAIYGEFQILCEYLDERASVLCHRDYHAANLMVDGKGDLRLIDHQDARIGTISYDLVSLLLDRITIMPDEEWIRIKCRYFLDQKEQIGSRNISFDDFEYEFAMQTIQRCLKASGTFSFQSANRGKTHFLQYIMPMFNIVIHAAEKIGRFPVLKNILQLEIETHT